MVVEPSGRIFFDTFIWNRIANGSLPCEKVKKWLEIENLVPVFLWDNWRETADFGQDWMPEKLLTFVNELVFSICDYRSMCRFEEESFSFPGDVKSHINLDIGRTFSALQKCPDLLIIRKKFYPIFSGKLDKGSIEDYPMHAPNSQQYSICRKGALEILSDDLRELKFKDAAPFFLQRSVMSRGPGRTWISPHKLFMHAFIHCFLKQNTAGFKKVEPNRAGPVGDIYNIQQCFYCDSMILDGEMVDVWSRTKQKFLKLGYTQSDFPYPNIYNEKMFRKELAKV